MPANVVVDAGDIDRILVTPALTTASAGDPARGRRLALGYLRARLGERLASGELKTLAAFDPHAEGAPEFTHLQGYLAAPWLAGLTGHLQAPDLDASLQKMRAVMRHE